MIDQRHRIVGVLSLLLVLSPALADLPKEDYFNAYTKGDELKHSDTQQTELALKTFLLIADEFIPSESSCQGEFGQKGRAKIVDLLVSRMAGQLGGTNNMFGLCDKKTIHQRCTLFISHASAEDAAAAQISIVIRNGKPDIKTLSCALD